jgi:hypothetical protein
VYLGRPTSYWKRDSRRWKIVLSGFSNKIGHIAVWGRSPSLVEELRERLGLLDQKEVPSHLRHPLLQGNAAAVPVLLELLIDTEVQVRVLAAQGLKEAAAKITVPQLVAAWAAEDDLDVRLVLADALKFLDRDAAERAGVRWDSRARELLMRLGRFKQWADP